MKDTQKGGKMSIKQSSERDCCQRLRTGTKSKKVKFKKAKKKVKKLFVKWSAIYPQELGQICTFICIVFQRDFVLTGLLLLTPFLVWKSWRSFLDLFPVRCSHGAGWICWFCGCFIRFTHLNFLIGVWLHHFKNTSSSRIRFVELTLIEKPNPNQTKIRGQKTSNHKSKKKKEDFFIPNWRNWCGWNKNRYDENFRESKRLRKTLELKEEDFMISIGSIGGRCLRSTTFSGCGNFFSIFVFLTARKLTKVCTFQLQIRQNAISVSFCYYMWCHCQLTSVNMSQRQKLMDEPTRSFRLQLVAYLSYREWNLNFWCDIAMKFNHWYHMLSLIIWCMNFRS